MKYFQFLTFTILSLTALALIIIAMSTEHWTATRTNPNENFLNQNNQAYGGLRRWYQEGQDSQKWNRNEYASNRFWVAGSWALGWGITSLALIVLAHVAITVTKATEHHEHRNHEAEHAENTMAANARTPAGDDGRICKHCVIGKMIASFLMFLAAACILVGCLTYWSHLPKGYDSLSWSFGLYVVGGGLALMTSILLCAMPTKHFHHYNQERVVAPVAVVKQPAGVMMEQPVMASHHGRTSSVQDVVVVPNNTVVEASA